MAQPSSRRLAAQIGYTPRTVYLYFADKDDLLSELIEEEVGRLADRLESAAATQRFPGRRLEAVTQARPGTGATRGDRESGKTDV